MTGLGLTCSVRRGQDTENNCCFVALPLDSREYAERGLAPCRMRIKYCPWTTSISVPDHGNWPARLFYAAETPHSSSATLAAFPGGGAYPDRDVRRYSESL